MKKIGLTGNIGSGKTTVARIFSTLGIPVYHADIEAKKILNHIDVINILTEKFGSKIITNHLIDKTKLANIVFSDKESLNYLNKLIHPLVKEDFDNWCIVQSVNNKYIIHEAAILFESNFYQYVDKTIIVTAPHNIRIERVISRDHISKEEVLTRMANQWDEEKKTELSDYIIINDNMQFVIPQVIDIHHKILKL